MNEIKSDKTITNAINKINPLFFNWLKTILKCDRTRSVSLCTFLLNTMLYMNYFPWFDTLIKESPDLIPKNLTINFKEVPFSSEIIYSIIILIALTYKFQDRISNEETDVLINSLTTNDTLVKQFFLFNSISPRYHFIKLEEFKDTLPKFTIKKNLLPKLEFDPEFHQVLENEALKQLYDTTFIKDYVASRETKQHKYVPEKANFIRNQKIYEDKKTKIFDIDPKLHIASFAYRHFNVFPHIFLSSHAQIDEILRVFINFYSNKLIIKKEEIEIVLSYFGVLLKLMEGWLYKKFRYGQLLKKLSLVYSKAKAILFLKKFCLNQKNMSFSDEFNNFNAIDFTFQHHKFLSFAAYQISGIVYTGTFLIWRAMIKYLESLQNEDEFRLQKGPLLENWCYEKAVEFGLKPEKIVLRNPKCSPSYLYNKMKQQTKDFPKQILELESEFLPDDKSSYHEIDLAIKVEDYVFIFECKTTSVPIGEYGDYVNWLDNYGSNIQLLIRKGETLLHNISNKIINHPSLLGIKFYVPFVLQTEGFISNLHGLDTSRYLELLRQLQDKISTNRIKEFLKDAFQKT